MSLRLPIFLISTLSLAAQERFAIGLSVGRVETPSQSYTLAVPGATTWSNIASTRASVPGVEAAWTVRRGGVLDLTVAALLRLPTSTDLAWDARSQVVSPVPTPVNTSVGKTQLQTRQSALVVRISQNQALDWSVGIRFAHETLKVRDEAPGPGILTATSATLFRPWFEAQVGTTFQSGTFRPYVALSAAASLSRPGMPTASDADFRTQRLRALAPGSEVALIAGVRF